MHGSSGDGSEGQAVGDGKHGGQEEGRVCFVFLKVEGVVGVQDPGHVVAMACVIVRRPA